MALNVVPSRATFFDKMGYGYHIHPSSHATLIERWVLASVRQFHLSIVRVCALLMIECVYVLCTGSLSRGEEVKPQMMDFVMKAEGIFNIIREFYVAEGLEDERVV